MRSAKNTRTRKQAAQRTGIKTPRSAFVTWALVGVCALALAGLRMHITRLQYALGDAIEVERDLIEEERRARARLASLRDPERLARIAERRGFAVPDRIVRVSSEAIER